MHVANEHDPFFVALRDEALFAGEGDRQFQVYRDMRAETREQWRDHAPRTNVHVGARTRARVVRADLVPRSGWYTCWTRCCMHACSPTCLRRKRRSMKRVLEPPGLPERW